MTAYSGHRSQRSEHSFDTISSVSFAAIDAKQSRSTQTFEYSNEEDDIRMPLRSFDSPAGTTRSTRSIRNSDRISITQLAFGLGNDPYGEETNYSSLSGQTTPSLLGITPGPPPTEHRNPSELPSMVRSLIIFQFAIITIHLLASITPLIDLVSARPKASALGTQHVALLFAGWAPVYHIRCASSMYPAFLRPDTPTRAVVCCPLPVRILAVIWAAFAPYRRSNLTACETLDAFINRSRTYQCSGPEALSWTV
ncbi:hypothetical protein B0H17DRAFT_563100 [Mycena rosella]|uniref:Uncharacterized protein n=1 Tax=Mycena rosella TaxID=1033263 RepID=A0AAD7BP86_MYCRO|nr:hypothetical protein B0H17DRAFT_563100 [Mycena rosella]